MTVYISGKISGDDNYKQKFIKKANELKSLGYRVLSPVMIDEELEYDDYMLIDYAMISVSHAVYFLSDWGNSKGAILERAYAKKLNKIIMEEKKDYAKRI